MAQKKQNIETANDDPFEPVTLDPPAPEIVRWQALADRDIDIYHDGDAEKVIPFPRPAWADPDLDDIAATWQSSFYRSAPVEVASNTNGGCNDGETLAPGRFRVSTRIHGCGQIVIGIMTRRFIDGEWHEWGGSIHPAGALELAEVLRAAVDLIGDEK